MGGFLEVHVGAGERFAGEEWMVLDGRDVAGAHLTIARILQSGPVPSGDGMAGSPQVTRSVSPAGTVVPR